MRLFLAGLFLSCAPGLAFAQCTCSCVGGRPVANCASSAMSEPICQNICTDSVGQTLSTPSVAAPSVGARIDFGPSSSSDIQEALQSGDLEAPAEQQQ